MGELSFSYAQSFEKIWPTGKTNWDAVTRVFDEARNAIETHESRQREIMLGISSKAKSRQGVERNRRL
jgi:arabinogalactan endo-1,4-beta-galactosidase